MTKEEIFEEARKRGFDKARSFTPAHLKHTDNPPIIDIPEDAFMRLYDTDLYYDDPSKVLLKGYSALIYKGKDNVWGDIASYKEEVKLIDEVMSKESAKPVLRDFPENGVCWEPTKELLEYLQARKSCQSGFSIPFSKIKGGVAWTKISIWNVASKSAQPEYSIKQLSPFFSKPNEVALRPLTPYECYPPEKWCVKIAPDNQDLLNEFLKEHKKEWAGYRDGWVVYGNGYFHYPPPNHLCHTDSRIEEGYTLVPVDKIMHVLTNKNDVQELTDFPKAGYCENPSTRVLDYLNANYKKMRCSGTKGVKWVTSVYQFWLSSGQEPNSGNMETYTSEQLEKILYNKSLKTKQNEHQKSKRETSEIPGTLKVQRPNLTVRRGDEIRATTIRCSKGKIRIGSVNSTNKA